MSEKSIHPMFKQILTIIVCAIALIIIYGWSQNGRYKMVQIDDNVVYPLRVLDTRTGDILRREPQ